MKTGARLNLKIAIVSMHIDPGLKNNYSGIRIPETF
jgi:hypothetical protein